LIRSTIVDVVAEQRQRRRATGSVVKPPFFRCFLVAGPRVLSADVAETLHARRTARPRHCSILALVQSA
jgi:hypothetical protein